MEYAQSYGVGYVKLVPVFARFADDKLHLKRIKPILIQKMQNIQKYIPWTIRIIIALLFAISGVTKMFPIWAFEKQLVDLGIADWCSAPYWTRFIIALEIAIGIAILQPHFLKKFIIPGSILLLSVFCVHLAIVMVKHGAMKGNCGCFGELLPMTPLEAFIKNIISICLLIYLYTKANDKEKGQNKSSYLLVILLTAVSLVFVLFPFCPCSPTETIQEAKATADLGQDEKPMMIVDTGRVNSSVLTEDSASLQKKQAMQLKDTTVQVGADKNTIAAAPVDFEPKMVISKFAKYTTFGAQTANLDKGQKIVCMFAPGCDHCRETARELCTLSKESTVPDVYIFFMDEDVSEIPAFFNKTQCNFPYQVINHTEFWQLFGFDRNTPGIFFQWNGNTMKLYEGNDENKFDIAEFRKALQTQR